MLTRANVRSWPTADISICTAQVGFDPADVGARSAASQRKRNGAIHAAARLLAVRR